MGAFGNYPQPHKYQIDYSDNKPIEVIANFNSSGKYKPEYFRMIINDEYFTYKIDTVKWFREYNHYDSFCCVYNNYGKQHEILLRYHMELCIWTMVV